MIKWILGIIVIVAAGALLWWSGWLGNGAPATQNTQATTTQQTASTQQQPQSDLPTANNDASDAALVQDTAAVDVQLKNLASDSTSVDQSFNDKPVAQDY